MMLAVEEESKNCVEETAKCYTHFMVQVQDQERKIGDHLKPQHVSKLACIFGFESATSFFILSVSCGKKCHKVLI